MNEYCTPGRHVCIGEPLCRKPSAPTSGGETPATASPPQEPPAEVPKRGRPPKSTPADTPKE